MRKTQKSKIYDYFEPINYQVVCDATYIIDGGFLLHRKIGLRCSKVCGHCRGQSCLNAESINDENDEDVDLNIGISPLDVLSATVDDTETEDMDNEC